MSCTIVDSSYTYYYRGPHWDIISFTLLGHRFAASSRAVVPLASCNVSCRSESIALAVFLAPDPAGLTILDAMGVVVVVYSILVTE